MRLRTIQTSTTPNKIPSVAPTNEGMGEASKSQSGSHFTANPAFELSNNSSAAQRARLLAHLQHVDGITTIHAKELLNIYDPPARKRELVEEGFDIEMTWVHATTAQGFTHRVGLYTLIQPCLTDVEVLA